MGRRLRTTAYLVAACAGLFAPASARAQANPAAAVPAFIMRADCAAACGAPGAVRPGSLLRIRGKTFARADQVVFMGGVGEGDDVVADVLVRRKTSADVRVPLGSLTGPIEVVDFDGAPSAPSLAPVVIEAAPASGPVELGLRTPRFYYDSAIPAMLRFVLHGAAADVSVDLAREDDGAIVAHWDLPAVPPESATNVTWDGLAAGKVQRTGRYQFRVTAGGVAQAPVSFDFARDRFPILGPVEFGTGVAAFGGGRGHQGEDTFAACGTPLVAAHGGVVKYAGYHARAGNYVVIDNEGSGTDYAYMHLRDPALVTTGARVYTGQPIGFVGDTGDATTCHLHFEIWTAPGWYSGGQPIDPLPSLRAWLAARPTDPLAACVTASKQCASSRS